MQAFAHLLELRLKQGPGAPEGLATAATPLRDCVFLTVERSLAKELLLDSLRDV